MAANVKGLSVIDSEGTRVVAKYYSADLRSAAERANLEKLIHTKTSRVVARGEAEVLTLEEKLVLYKHTGDILFCIVGPADENELLLLSVLDTLISAIGILLRGPIDRVSILDSMHLVLLAIDEIVDGGYVFETDPAAVANRVLMKSGDAESVGTDYISFSQAYASAKEQFARSFLK